MARSGLPDRRVGTLSPGRTVRALSQRGPRSCLRAARVAAMSRGRVRGTGRRGSPPPPPSASSPCSRSSWSSPSGSPIHPRTARRARRRSPRSSLPAWSFHAAYITLISVIFIFPHFFSAHLKPENWPFDKVVFAGSPPVDHYKQERPLGAWGHEGAAGCSCHSGGAPTDATCSACHTDFRSYPDDTCWSCQAGTFHKARKRVPKSTCVRCHRSVSRHGNGGTGQRAATVVSDTQGASIPEATAGCGRRRTERET